MEDNTEYTILNALYPTLEKNLSNKDNVKKLMLRIKKYADSHSDILLSVDMSQRLMFSENDKNLMYEVTGLEQSLISKTAKSSPVIKSTWVIATNPFYISCLLTARFFELKNKKAEMEAVIVYMSYILYSSSHRSSFPYVPNKQIMDYTMNNLSNRYLIKQVGTIQGMIEHTVINAINGRYEKDLRDCSDIYIKDILSALETRMSSVIKYIAAEYYKNHKSGEYLFHEEDSEDENNYHLSDNISYKIDRIVNLVSSSVISEGFDYSTCVRRAINLNSGASNKKLEPMLRTIIDDDMEEIKPMISDILTLFIYKGTPGNNINDVNTMRFVSEALQIYKSNSQDEVTTRLKVRLKHWIDITAEKYGRNFISKGKTSLDTYRRAIYTCFIFKIVECGK